MGKSATFFSCDDYSMEDVRQYVIANGGSWFAVSPPHFCFGQWQGDSGHLTLEGDTSLGDFYTEIKDALSSQIGRPIRSSLHIELYQEWEIEPWLTSAVINLMKTFDAYLLDDGQGWLREVIRTIGQDRVIHLPAEC